MSADETRALDFLHRELARPAEDIAAVLRAAEAARASGRGDDRTRGIVAAGLWLGQARDLTPVTRESYYPLRNLVDGEAAVARRIAADEDARPDPRATDVTSGYAQGVAEMLAYAIDSAAPAPIGTPSSGT